jgi:lipoprotein signal peptidase
MKPNVRIAVILLTVFGCVGCDQVTKSIARDHLPFQQVISLLNDTVRLEHTENPGAFLSLGDTLSGAARRVLFTLGRSAIGDRHGGLGVSVEAHEYIADRWGGLNLWRRPGQRH